MSVEAIFSGLYMIWQKEIEIMNSTCQRDLEHITGSIYGINDKYKSNIKRAVETNSDFKTPELLKQTRPSLEQLKRLAISTAVNTAIVESQRIQSEIQSILSREADHLHPFATTVDETILFLGRLSQNSQSFHKLPSIKVVLEPLRKYREPNIDGYSRLTGKFIEATGLSSVIKILSSIDLSDISNTSREASLRENFINIVDVKIDYLWANNRNDLIDIIKNLSWCEFYCVQHQLDSVLDETWFKLGIHADSFAKIAINKTCPSCGNIIDEDYMNYVYCHNCGFRLRE